MKLEDVIREYKKLTPAQTYAFLFHDKCAQSNKRIEYEIATASVYIDAFTSEEYRIIRDLRKALNENIEFDIYPHGNQLEIWFL